MTRLGSRELISGHDAQPPCICRFLQRREG
jgi:hypothetical protein